MENFIKVLNELTNSECYKALADTFTEIAKKSLDSSIELNALAHGATTLEYRYSGEFSDEDKERILKSKLDEALYKTLILGDTDVTVNVDFGDDLVCYVFKWDPEAKEFYGQDINELGATVVYNENTGEFVADEKNRSVYDDDEYDDEDDEECYDGEGCYDGDEGCDENEMREDETVADYLKRMSDVRASNYDMETKNEIIDAFYDAAQDSAFETLFDEKGNAVGSTIKLSEVLEYTTVELDDILPSTWDLLNNAFDDELGFTKVSTKSLPDGDVLLECYF